MRANADLYRFHCENLLQVTNGIDRVARLTRTAIATDDASTEYSLIRLHALLLGTWAECRLKKLLYEPSGFSDQHREAVRGLPSQIERWNLTVELAFRFRFNAPNAELRPPSIPFAAAARYGECVSLLDTEVRPIIELRNKFAHGQWEYLLNSDEDDVKQDQMAMIRRENLMTLQFRRDLLTHIATLINDLVVSTAFDRDFDTHYNQVAQTKLRIQRQSYNAYASRLKRRHLAGQQQQRA